MRASQKGDLVIARQLVKLGCSVNESYEVLKNYRNSKIVVIYKCSGRIYFTSLGVSRRIRKNCRISNHFGG